MKLEPAWHPQHAHKGKDAAGQPQHADKGMDAAGQLQQLTLFLKLWSVPGMLCWFSSEFVL